MQYDKKGFYRIISLDNGKSLTINDEGIFLKEYTELDSQKWVITDSKINGWIIAPFLKQELCLSINGKIENDSEIILSKNEKTDNKMFYMYNINKEEKKKANGIYKIAVGKAPNKSIEIFGDSKTNNAVIQIGDFQNKESQKFSLIFDDNGFYRIASLDTGKCLTIKNENINEGEQIVQYEYKELDTQKWILIDSKINGWIITPLYNTSLTITIDGNINSYDNLKLSKNETNNNQMFYIFNLSESEKTKNNGPFNIAVGKDLSKSIEIAGSSKDNNAKVDIWKYGNVRAQKFNLEYINGFYKITACHTGKSLSVKNNNLKSGEQIVQDEYKEEIGQMWIIRDSKINGWVISPLARPDLALTVEKSITDGSRIILEELQYNNRQMFYLFTVRIAVEIDSNKYPGYADRLDQLVTAHPNWEFEILYTTINFNTAVQSEYVYEGKRGNLVYTPTYKGEWIAPDPYTSGKWASASYNGIAYFMDSRNFLNDVDIFQFLDLSDYECSGATLSTIQYQLDGTFLQNYAGDVKWCCQHVNINPYYAMARLFQEQGRDGSSTIYMDGGDGNLYFNPFNIGAKVGNDYQTALERARNNGWNTMAKGIEGGLRVIKSYYIDKYQNTLYLNKFDVNPRSGGGFYDHQYMQNLSAAYSEARILRGAYVDTNSINNKLKFIIPVYENMSSNISRKPNG